MPELAGIHHVKIPVTDLDRARDWYARVLGFRVTLEFPDAEGVLRGVGGPLPGLGDTLLALRVNPEAALGCRNFDPVSFAVRDRAAVEAWAAHLDALGVPHSPLIEATLGPLLVFDDPDGIQLHLYGREQYGVDPSDLTGVHLTLDDGRPAVRFTRTYAHPVARVWRFVTDPAELAHWFPSRVAMDLRPGGTIHFSGDPNLPESTGRVLAVDALSHLSFAWGGDELHFDLEPDGDERTRLTLTDVLERADAAARNAAGWEVCLAALDTRAAGGPAAAPDGGTRSWEAYYRACLAAGFPSGAPVPGAT